jgi:hypothetical protein
MTIDDPTPLSDRQARNVIIAAERLGFEREPDLPFRWYDHELHDDAEFALKHLRERDPDALREALVAGEPIPPDRAAYRIVQTGGFSLADAYELIPEVAKLGFTPPPDLVRDSTMGAFGQAEACIAFLWEHHPSRLAELVGEQARLAPLPTTAECPWHERWGYQHLA